ncbi:amino acid permease [Sphingopyxis macrogoltabida]|nr:amino acid permease [Sphingopyxis macrogoltabida]ALJ14716.1 amino acid permease [Sphingopyxis macrogoltabida]
MKSKPNFRLFDKMSARKSIAQIQHEAATSQLDRTLGKWHLLLIGVGCIIGAGIFVRTGSAAALHAGPAVLLSFLIAGGVCAFAGLCYAEIASTLPVSGSAYTYGYATLGEFVAWTMGTLLLLEYGLAASVVAVGWSGYVVNLLADVGLHIPPEITGPPGQMLDRGGTPVMAIFNLPAFLVCLALTALLTRGLSESAKLNNLVVMIKLGVLAAFIIVGAFVALPHIQDLVSRNWTPFIPANQGDGKFGIDGIMRAASIVFFSYIGFEAVSTAGQEAKNPEKDLPFAIIGSLVVCTVIYTLVAAVMTLLLPYGSLDVPEPVALVVDSFGGGWTWLAAPIKIGAIIGLTSVVLVLIYGQTRIFYAMARDGLLPRIFAAVHPKFRTPHINTALVGTLTALAAGLCDLNLLGDMTSVGTLAAFAIVCVSVIYLRRAAPDLPRGFSTPFYPLIPLLGIGSCLYLITTVPWDVLAFFFWYMLAGLLLYFVYGIRHSHLRSDGAEP